MGLPSKVKNILDLKRINSNNEIIIPNFFYYNKKELIENIEIISKKIFEFNKESDLIIRSSANDEDNDTSNAGKYSSLVLFKKSKYKKTELKNKLKIFVKQFKKQNDYIIFQEYIKKVNYAGVIFTSEINYDSPYIVINYDETGKTNLITSGQKNLNQKNLFIFKKDNFLAPKKFIKLIKLIFILEKKFNNNRLDIEFAIKKEKIYIFQIRKLANQKRNIISKKKIFDVLTNINKKITKFQLKNTLHGKTSYFSNMSDWNPAEMLGNKPNYLGLTIYKELITNNIWSQQRKSYGYKDVSPYELLINFAGSPYIDLRTDLNSFLPKNLPIKLGDKIINNSLNLIRKNPYLHDKIEFECINTCLSLDTKNKVKFLNKKEQNIYLDELKKITNNAINEKLLNTEINKIKSFLESLKVIKKKKISTIQKIFYINYLTKEKASLPFAGLARIAFISTKILKDLNKIGLITEEYLRIFFSKINSINIKLNQELCKIKSSKNGKKKFLDYFGHLRPSTYDINSKNYLENFDNYFKNYSTQIYKKIYKKNSLQNKKKIETEFKKLGYNFSVSQFLKIAQKAINYREEGKFIYSKGVNEILCQILLLGKEMKIKRNDLAHLDYNIILNANSNLESEKFKKTVNRNINKNKNSKKILDLIKLPDIIFKEDDPFCYEDDNVKGNFVTLEECYGDIKKINTHLLDTNSLNNKIIFIESADPGYDFIFNFNIKGLVTKYGGLNSHMSIRCLELNIPAVIGIGDKKYKDLSNSNKIFINCKKEIIDKIN